MTITARRKLWELGDYQCPILGTCLTMAELRKLARKLGVTVDPGASDYELHGFFVGQCRREGPVAAQVQKFLDRKYRKDLRLFAKAGHVLEQGGSADGQSPETASDAALEALWKHCVKSGDIPGPFWAIMSHPRAGSALLDRVYGEVHMLSHLMGAANRADLRRLSRLERRIDELGQALSRVQQARRASRLEWATKVRELEGKLEAERGERLRLDRRLREAALSHAPARLAQAPGPDAPARLLEAEREENRRQSLAIEELYRENAALRERMEEANAELERAEAELVRLLPCADGGGCGPGGRSCGRDAPVRQTPSGSCLESGCSEATCPLSGKTVLYVGGRCGLVRHYRELVERRGASFHHHDGGMEDGPCELHGKLASADIVLCPVDCVSHEACQAVKKACRNRMKPLVMLRSSGLTSLARCLDGPLEDAATRAN